MHFRWGKRKPQSYTYSPYFPQLQYNRVLKAFFGGNFWDSRSTGYKLSSPDAEQAQHPPVDPDEQGFPDTACIAYRLSHAEYRPLFELVWGEGSFDIKWPVDTETICSTPEGAAVFNGSRNALHQHLSRSSRMTQPSDAVAMPVALGLDDRAKANNVFDHWAQALDAFETSANVSAFSSKFDAFLAGNYTLTADEQAGYDLFRGKGNCNSCHLDARGTALKSDQTDTSSAPGGAPLFTCFGSANEGLPRNPVIPFYYETKPDAFLYTPNPAGFGFKDLGMGLFLRSLSGNNPNTDWIQYAPSVDGQMQVSSARNAAMTPPNCPHFQKAFFHDGYVKSLKELVHFYNTRDVFAYPVQSGHCPPGTIEKVTCWPEPEVKNNMDMTTGNLGLTDHEEDLIVIFLGTLTDGFTTPYPDADKYTGNCLPPTALSPPSPPVSAAPVPSGLTPSVH
jgi:cytochrome c peroxidase